MTFGVREKFGPLAWRDDIPASVRGAVVSVGNFDGVHRGHVELIRHARLLSAPEALATEEAPVAYASGSDKCRVTIVTFDPHPLQILAPERFQPPLTTLDDRVELLLAKGAAAVVVIRTDRDLLDLTPERFFQQVLIERLSAAGIVEGFNFRFGHDRAGSVDTMRDLCAAAGIPFRMVDPFKRKGVVVSSSRVRDAIVAGDVQAAAEWLDGPYFVRGTVIEGAKRGRTIGFPTANLGGVTTILPCEGVYAVSAKIGEPNCVSNRVFAAAANIGPNPTFGDNARKIEVHLIGFSGDLYGKKLTVEFMERLRETRRFNSVDELVAQMRLDVERAESLILL